MTGAEICAKCQQPTVADHSLSLDAINRLWRLCCLCTAELIAQLDHSPETSAR